MPMQEDRRVDLGLDATSLEEGDDISIHALREAVSSAVWPARTIICMEPTMKATGRRRRRPDRRGGPRTRNRRRWHREGEDLLGPHLRGLVRHLLDVPRRTRPRWTWWTWARRSASWRRSPSVSRVPSAPSGIFHIGGYFEPIAEEAERRARSDGKAKYTDGLEWAERPGVELEDGTKGGPRLALDRQRTSRPRTRRQGRHLVVGTWSYPSGR